MSEHLVPVLGWLAVAVAATFLYARRRPRIVETDSAWPMHFTPQEADPPVDTRAGELIRQDARCNAIEAWQHGQNVPVNPHRQNTRQFVLWATTWFLTWEELSDADRESAHPDR